MQPPIRRFTDSFLYLANIIWLRNYLVRHVNISRRAAFVCQITTDQPKLAQEMAGTFELAQNYS
jgi:hypothetical protein